MRILLFLPLVFLLLTSPTHAEFSGICSLPTIQTSRMEFLKEYRKKNYTKANIILERKLEECPVIYQASNRHCGSSNNWTKNKNENALWFVSDTMLSRLKVGKIEDCLTLGDTLTADLLTPQELDNEKILKAISTNYKLCKKSLLSSYPIQGNKCSIPNYENFIAIPDSWRGIWNEALCIKYHEPEHNEFLYYNPRELPTIGLKQLPFFEILYAESIPIEERDLEDQRLSSIEDNTLRYNTAKLFFKADKNTANVHQFELTEGTNIWGGESCNSAYDIRFSKTAGKIYFRTSGGFCWQSKELHYGFMEGHLVFPFYFKLTNNHMTSYY